LEINNPVLAFVPKHFKNKKSQERINYEKS